MANLYWQGDATDIAQVSTITPANPSVGDVFTITINGHDVSYTVVAADLADEAGDGSGGNEASAVANVVDGLYAAVVALQALASCPPEWQEVTATDSTTHLTLTANTAGKPFTVTATSTNDGSATNEVQSLAISGTPTGGTFTLTYDGQTTAGIAYNANAAAVQSALEALSNVATNDIVCTGGALPGTAVTMTFSGTGTTEETNVSQIYADGASLTGGTSPAATVTTTTQGLAGADTNTAATTTANTGRNNWDNADNWSTGSVPVNSDNVFIRNTSVPIKYGFGQSAVTLASLDIRDTLAGFYLGLPDLNTDAGTNVDQNVGSVAAYSEYRTKVMAISATSITIDCDASLIRLDTGSNQTTITVHRTGRPAQGYALEWIGTHASNALYVDGTASVGVATGPGDSATLATLGINGSQATVECGSGTTLSSATITVQAGNLILNSNWQTLNQFGGVVLNRGTATGTTLTQEGGTFQQDSTGTLTTLDCKGATFDCSISAKLKTTTNTIVRDGAKFLDPAGTHTETNGFDVYGDLAGLSPTIRIVKPIPRTYTLSAV